MIDCHAHLLPGIDDGSDSVETSIRMLDMWRSQGFDHICATPHFYADQDAPERFLRRRQKAFDTLTAAMAAGGPYPLLLLGAEVRFFDAMSDAECLPELCLQGTRLLLLEMPFIPWSRRVLSEVAEIRRRGIKPIAAHIERYMDIQPKNTFRSFLDLDILIQCNAEFFLTRRTRRKALKLLADERIHFLGSDAHDTDSRPPNLGPALKLIEEKLGPDPLARLGWFEEQLLTNSEVLL